MARKTPIALLAKRTQGTADFPHPAWAIYIGTSTVPQLRIDCVPGIYGWEIVALATRYGVSHYDEELAEAIQAGVRKDMHLREVLAVVRGAVEYQLEMFASEAEAEQYAENAWLRHAERTTFEDMAFEEWEQRNCW
jgi:hypothetical protein